MNRFFISVIVPFFCILCGAQSIKVQDSKSKRLIDLDKVQYPDTGFLSSKLFKSVKIVPLETNKSCLVGEIGKVQAIDDYLLVMDGTFAKSLYVFDREGRFIRKIGGIGQGPGEYISIGDFTVDSENKAVYILDGRISRIHKYNLATGRFIQTINFERNPKAGGADIHHIVHAGGKLYASAAFFNHSPDNYLLFSINESTGKEQNNFLNVMEYNKGFSNQSGNRIPYESFFLRANGDAIFVRPMMNHIIEITKEGVFSLVEFKGKNMMTQSDAEKLFELYNIKNMIANPIAINQFKKYNHITDYIENSEWIHIEMRIGMAFHLVAINKRTDEVCVYSKEAKSNLLFKKREDSRFYSYGCADSKGVYHCVSSRSSSEFPEYYKAGMLSPDVIGLEKLKDFKDDDNPILIYYEFNE